MSMTKSAVSARLAAGLGAWLLACLWAGGAYAETEICPKPEVPGEDDEITLEELAALSENVQAYLDCITPILEAKRTRTEVLLAEARDAAEDNNRMASEVNEVVHAFNGLRAAQASKIEAP